jgi:hypothetical protein
LDPPACTRTTVWKGKVEKSVLWIRIGFFNADPDTDPNKAFFVNADPDPDPGF